jgi:hypothetical protein
MYGTFYPKIFTKFSEIWVEDPGSGKTSSGSRVKKASDPGYGSETLEYPACNTHIYYYHQKH